MKDAPRVRIRVFKGRVWYLVRASVEGFCTSGAVAKRYLCIYFPYLKKEKKNQNSTEL